MKEFDFDNIKSKLVPDEKLIVYTINKINEKNHKKTSNSIWWVKYAACVLVFAIIAGVLPFALKNNNSVTIQPKTDEEISTKSPETNLSSGEQPSVISELKSVLMYTSMLRIIKYTDCVKEHMFYVSFGVDVAGILAEVEFIFFPADKAIKKEIFVPLYLYEENYFDYLVVGIRQKAMNGKNYWVTSAYDDGLLDGFAFKDGKVDFSNKHFWGENYPTLWDLNTTVGSFEYHSDDYYPKQAYPNYHIVDGLSAEEVKSFLEKAYDCAYWVDKRSEERRRKDRENGVIRYYC